MKKKNKLNLGESILMSHQQEEKSTPFVVSNLYWQYTLVENGRSVASGKIVYLSLQNPGRD